MLLTKEKQGFTLIETAIVMVVIGLLVAGVAVGRDLIRAGQIRASIRQIEQLDTAISTFRNQYDCLPGDCINATENNFATVYYGGVSVNGNGDGMIKSSGGESYQAVGELAEIGLLVDVKPDAYCCSVLTLALPTRDNTNNYRGIIDIDYFKPDATNYSSISVEGHYYWLRGAPFDTTPGATNILLPEDAYAIDVKMDDGNPRTGKVLSTGRIASGSNTFGKFPAYSAVPDSGAAGASSNYCVTSDTPNQYNVLNVSRASGSLCTMTIKTAF